MYHELPPKRCSKCGSLRNENFNQGRKSGIRCLDCGHEHVTKEKLCGGSQITWTRVETDNSF